MTPPKVLVADDDPDVRFSIKVLLRAFCEIVEAEDGKGAIGKVQAERPRLVFLDYSMPDMTGVEVLEQVRKIDPAMIVIMLTSHVEMQIAKKALASGANMYVTKPFDIDYLRNEVRRLLGLDDSGDADKSGRPWRVNH